MPAALRSKKSTISNQVEAFQDVTKLPEPTRALSPRGLRHFTALVTSREASTWSPVDLVIATNAAMTLDAIDAQWDNIEANGWHSASERGTPVANPASTQLNSLSNSLRAFIDKLGLSASQRGLSNTSQTGRNKAENETRNVLKRVSSDDLL